LNPQHESISFRNQITVAPLISTVNNVINRKVNRPITVGRLPSRPLPSSALRSVGVGGAGVSDPDDHNDLVRPMYIGNRDGHGIGMGMDEGSIFMMERHTDLHAGRAHLLGREDGGLAGSHRLAERRAQFVNQNASLPIFHCPFLPCHPPIFLSLDPQSSFSYHHPPQDANLIIFGFERGDPGRDPEFTLPPLIRG
jgi:hypothetical protein